MPPHTTEPDVVGADAQAAAAAKGAPRAVGEAGPIAASAHTQASGCRSGWICGRGLTIGRPIPIPAPLIHVARHVVKPVTVRRKIAHWTRVGLPAGIEVGVVAVRA